MIFDHLFDKEPFDKEKWTIGYLSFFDDDLDGWLIQWLSDEVIYFEAKAKHDVPWWLINGGMTMNNKTNSIQTLLLILVHDWKILVKIIDDNQWYFMMV